MKVVQTNLFKTALKKLHANQKADLDNAVKAIMESPDLGQSKTGDLSGILVYKFKMVKQPTLLAYSCDDQTMTLLALGTHENFYRDIKKSL